MAEPFGKESKSGFDNSQEQLVAESVQLAEVRRNLASLAEVEHLAEEPTISDEMTNLGVYSPQQQAELAITQGPTIVLPLTSAQIKRGLHQQVFAAIHWLAVWCLRVALVAKHKGFGVILGKGPAVSLAELNRQAEELEE